MILSKPAVPFFDSAAEPVPGAPALVGVPYDGTACFRKGAAAGPDAIRQLSDGLESYSPRLDRDLSERPFADLGNLELGTTDPEGVVLHVHDACRELLAEQALPLLLGGEHSFTPGAVAALAESHPDLAVVQFDAHADLREEWTGTRWSHACAMRRTLEFVASSRLRQCGIRSGTREEFAELNESGRLVAPGPLALAESLAGLGDAPLYLTIDLDLFDPSVLPGTGTPEPGGLDWATFESLLTAIPWSRVVGCDIVELAPALDASGCSTLVAAKVVREILLSLP